MRVVEEYDTPDGRARRFWAREPRLLVGGRILDAADGEHLRRDFGVTHVLSVESEHDDEASGFDVDCRLRVPFPDGEPGQPIGAAVIEACTNYGGWAVGAARIGGGVPIQRSRLSVLYVHCMMGGARGPAIAYAIAVSLGALPGPFADELRAVGCNLRPVFIDSINRALGVRTETP